MALAAEFSTTVVDGPLAVAVLVAALVGLVGFLSPCVLPLVPGYLSYLAGMTDTDRAHGQRRVIAGALLFALGFTVVLVVSADVLFVGVGRTLVIHRVGIERVLGGVTIVMGVVFLGGLSRLQREVRLFRRPSAGLLGAPLLGATFGLAWTPCLTPTFTAVVGLASSEATAQRGLVLTAAYCVGLSIPFVLIASGFTWTSRAVGLVRRHALGVHRFGGAMLVLIGLALVTGVWTDLMNDLRAWLGNASLGPGL